MNFPLIVIIKDSIIDESKVATPETCEQVFLDTCRERISNFDEYSQNDIDIIVDQGYETFGNGSVCLHWVDGEAEVPVINT